MKEELTSLIIYIIIFGTIMYGWLFNLVSVIGATMITGKVLVGLIGILVAPIGVIMGLFVW